MTSQESEKYWDAKEQERIKSQRARDAAIIRTMNKDTEELRETKTKLAVSRATLMVAIAVNFYIAAQHAGIL